MFLLMYEIVAIAFTIHQRRKTGQHFSVDSIIRTSLDFIYDYKRLLSRARRNCYRSEWEIFSPYNIPNLVVTPASSGSGTLYSAMGRWGVELEKHLNFQQCTSNWRRRDTRGGKGHYVYRKRVDFVTTLGLGTLCFRFLFKKQVIETTLQ